jgi:hypothetical protein
MLNGKATVVIVFWWLTLGVAYAQELKVQQGLLLKFGSNIRLGGVKILNKRNRVRTLSNTAGVFNIQAVAGDTLSFVSDDYQHVDFMVTDMLDKVVYMQSITRLDEVVVKESSLKSDINEAMRGYREKSVFYNGNPHYYYLVLKPMTFIYENFKSEKIFARRFAKYARRELTSYKVSERFNDSFIKAAVPIKDAELEDFKSKYTPMLDQLNKMSDYDLINYIRRSYQDFKKNVLKQNGGEILNSTPILLC